MESMTWQEERKKAARGSGGAYDGAFSTGQRFKAPAAVEDYTEIFGAGARGSSIPVLDLSALDETSQNYRSSKIDYANIFGGFDEDLALPYQELISKCSSNNNARKPQEDEFGNCEERPSEAIDPSLDAIKQFNMSYLKTSQGNKNKLNGTTHVAKLHAVPGFTYFVNEPPSKQKTESRMPIPPIKGEVHHTWSFGGNIADENNRKTEMLLPAKPNAESLSGSKGGSQSTDRSFNRNESFLKSQSFKTATSSNNPLESFGIRGHPKRSKSSSISLKANPFVKSTSNGTDGSSDEEFDKNSDAAACAAALKRVLEKAQESIRLAKEIRERGEKDGIRNFSNLSSERSSKAKDKKKNKFDQETNNSKKQSVKDIHGRLGSELYEYNERNSRLGSRSTGFSTTAKCSQELLTSTEAEKGKSQLSIAEVDGKSKQFLDLVDARKSIASDLASNQVEMDKSIAFLPMRKEESEASLSVGKQESVIVETITAETLEQKEKDVVIETSINNFAFLSMRKQETVVVETTPAETLDQKEKNIVLETSIDNDFRRGNSENNVHVDEQTQVSEVTANASDSAPIKHEFRTSVGLDIAEKGAQSADTKCILDEPRHCEIKLPEWLDMREETKPEPSKTEDQHMLYEWQNPAKEEEPNEDQVQSELQFAYSHSEEQKENEFCSCNEGGIVQQEASGFVVSDAAPEVCASESRERTHKDSQEGEACVKSNELDSCHEGGMVQQEAWGVVASDDAPTVCDSGRCERTQKDGQEVEICGTSNNIQDIGVDDAKLTSEHDVEETPNDKKLVHVPPEEKTTEVHNKEHREGEDQNISEETYSQVKVDWNVLGEKFDWGEVEKRIKKGCTGEDAEMLWSEIYKISACQNEVEKARETEETTGVHEENGNFDHDEQIGVVRKAAHENNFDPDAYVRLHDVQEAHSTSVFGDHDASNSTTGTSEEFYNCEWEGNSGEKSLKACDSTDSDERSDFVHCPSESEDHVSSSGTSGLFMAFESDGNGTNPDHNGLSHEHKLPQETVLEAACFVEDAEKDVDNKLKPQDISEDQKATNVAFSADSQGTVTDNNVKEPEPSLDPKSGGDFLYTFRQNAEHVNEEFSFDKEDEDVDPKVIPKVENKEKEIDETNSSAVTAQATITQESEEEMITGQNNQCVGRNPQINALPEDNEARESSQKDLKEIEHSRKIEAAMKRERERDKDRIAVERAIREARERAFAEVRERAERAAVARAGAEVRQRMMAEARDKLETASAGTKIANKASIEAKQRAERAAVERATAEVRERALEKAVSQKSTSQGRVKTDRLSGTPKDSALKQSFSSDLERSDGSNSESAQRRKARLERHERIMERAAKALAEKNMRDLQAQKEQAERNRLAESVDADVKRWANGKEGNLRALLSTLQYILGPDSGWKPISLTEIITSAAVKKAYRKATLYVHPDKLQQRGASIQQKYICEKVFDLLKAAWSKSNSEER